MDRIALIALRLFKDSPDKASLQSMLHSNQTVVLKVWLYPETIMGRNIIFNIHKWAQWASITFNLLISPFKQLYRWK